MLNHNKLLWRYEGCNGVKTGYTRKSGRCLVSTATRNGIELIAVTLAAPNDWADHESMLDLGFSSYERRSLANYIVRIPTLPIVGSKTERLELAISQNGEKLSIEDISFPARIGSETKVRLSLPLYKAAEIKADEVIGELLIYEDDRPVLKYDIIAAHEVRSKNRII